jgi:hypothetical protein
MDASAIRTGTGNGRAVGIGGGKSVGWYIELIRGGGRAPGVLTVSELATGK